MATEVFVGDPARFPDGKALASYVGMIPSEHSSGRRQRLGALSKQGNPFLRFLWCGARGTAPSRSAEPNALWCADYKGEFMLGVHRYCYPLTITEFASRLLTCEALSTTREKRSSSGRSRNSACRRRPDRQRRAVRIRPRPLRPQQTRRVVAPIRHGDRTDETRASRAERPARAHASDAEEATKPAAANVLQQARFDAFIEPYNRDRPHQGLGMKVPADVYARSARVYRRFCAPGGIRRRLH